MELFTFVILVRFFLLVVEILCMCCPLLCYLACPIIMLIISSYSFFLGPLWIAKKDNLIVGLHGFI